MGARAPKTALSADNRGVRPRHTEPRFLTRDEVERLAEAAGEYADVVRLLAYTGLRFGEMAALRVRRLDFLRKRLTVAESATEVGGTVEYGEPKTHQQRTVPIPGVLLEPLAARCPGQASRRPRPDLARGRGAALGQLPQALLRPAARAAGLPGFTPHDLRHTAASLAVSDGASVKAVQRLLGHASAAMTLDIYTGLFDDDLQALAERMDAAHDAHKTSRAVGAAWARDHVIKIDDHDTSR